MMQFRIFYAMISFMDITKKYFAIFIFSVFILCASAGTTLAHCGHGIQKSDDIKIEKSCGGHDHGSAGIELDLEGQNGQDLDGSDSDSPKPAIKDCLNGNCESKERLLI